MVAQRHGYMRTATRLPPGSSWANEKEQMADRKGWARRDNQRYIAQLQEEDRNHKRRHGKNSGKMCDKCTMGEHDLCWRVVCYCPCLSNKEWNNAQPYRKVVFYSGDTGYLE